MREFVYYSANAVTAGNLIGDNLMEAGRLDIVCNFIVSVFFVSNAMREDVRLHLIFDGGPNNPRHLVFESNEEMPISKKNVAGLIKRMLYKAKDEEGLREICPGCSIEKKGFEKLVMDLDKEGKDVLVLSEKGEDIRDVEIDMSEDKNSVFLIGDHEGFPSGFRKFLKRIDGVSVGPKVLFASQVATIIHNELDRKES
ncbi:MAG: tRNA (pseudouridine(54)-N(1))-methyltransferase TrmY [archaeon]